jgi:hypothetical protein
MSFRWDHCWVCQGQGIKNYPQNLGTITFGEGTMAALPEIAGIATVTYPVPGTYTVTVKINATCIDRNHPDNACGARQTFKWSSLNDKCWVSAGQFEVVACVTDETRTAQFHPTHVVRRGIHSTR